MSSLAIVIVEITEGNAEKHVHGAVQCSKLNGEESSVLIWERRTDRQTATPCHYTR